MYLCRPKDGKKGIEVGVIFGKRSLRYWKDKRQKAKPVNFLIY